MDFVRELLLIAVNVLLCTFAGVLGMSLLIGCLAAVVRGLHRMGAELGRTGGRAALVGVTVLAFACLLFAQKANAPRTGLSAAPHAASARTVAADGGDAPDGIPELTARPAASAATGLDGLRFTGIERTPYSVLLGVEWPLAGRAAGDTLDILGRARLDEGCWTALAWTLPPASSSGFEVEVPAELLPEGSDTASFFALAPSSARDSDGDGLTNAQEAMWGTNPSGDDQDEDGAPDGVDTDGDGVSDGDEVAQSSDPADASDGGVPGSRVKVVFRFGDDSLSESERYRLELACAVGDGLDVARVSPCGRSEPSEVMLKPGCAYEVRLCHAGTDPKFRGDPNYPDYDYELALISSPPNVLLEDPQGIFGVVGADSGGPFAARGKTARIVVLLPPGISGPRYVGVNDDDDNGDGTRDDLNYSEVQGEDDLAEVRVSLCNPYGVSGTMRLTMIALATEVTLWKDRTKREFVSFGESIPVAGDEVERTYYLEGLRESARYGAASINVEFTCGDAVVESEYSFSVIRRIVDPLTLEQVGGLLVNPCCAIAGSAVQMKVDALPTGFPEEDIRWEVVSGSGTFGNGGTGSTVSFTPGSAMSDMVLRARFGDAPGQTPGFRMKVLANSPTEEGDQQ